ERAADVPDQPVAAHHEHALARGGRGARLLDPVPDPTRRHEAVLDARSLERRARVLQQPADPPGSRGRVDQEQVAVLAQARWHSTPATSAYAAARPIQ